MDRRVLEKIRNLVSSADDDGCEGLVVVGLNEFLALVRVCDILGFDVSSYTHIEGD